VLLLVLVLLGQEVEGSHGVSELGEAEEIGRDTGHVPQDGGGGPPPESQDAITSDQVCRDAVDVAGCFVCRCGDVFLLETSLEQVEWLQCHTRR